jgi:hypothetical protein
VDGYGRGNVRKSQMKKQKDEGRVIWEARIRERTGRLAGQ